MLYPFSKSLQNLSDCLKRLPGIGAKSAQRMCFYLLNQDRDLAELIIRNLQTALDNSRNCAKCRILCDSEICLICKERREPRLCIVESPQDAISLEHTGGFRGSYFVLMGRISPLEGMGPNEIGISLLEERLQHENLQEIIIATSYTVEGEATAHYLSKVCGKYDVQVSRIAYGVPIGSELEYLDGATLIRALQKREIYQDVR